MFKEDIHILLVSAKITPERDKVSIVYKLKVANTKKEAWLLKLIERSGHRKAAVALANKNVRTAWAMLKNNTTYQAA